MKKIYLLLIVIITTGLVNTAFAQQWWLQNSGTTVNLQNINFYDNNTGIAFGDTLTTIVRTSNQGAAWNGVNMSYLDGDIHSSAYITANTIVAVGKDDQTGNGVAMRSTSGGSTWLPDPTLPEQVYDLTFFDALQGWICGKNGYISRTSDGGVTWTAQTSGTSEDLNTIKFTTLAEAWVVGTGNPGTILYTGNSGALWSPQTSNTTEDLNGVYFDDVITGWAVGNNGTIMATTDGGTNWVAQTSGTNEDLSEVVFLDPATGWVVGDNGTVLATNDGGSSWSTQSTPTTEDLHSLIMKSTSLGWACGDNGTIIIYAVNNPGVNELQGDPFEVSIHPNPSNAWATVNCYNCGNDWNMVLYDVTGKEVLRQEAIKGGQATIGRPKLDAGTYILEVTNAEGHSVSNKMVFR